MKKVFALFMMLAMVAVCGSAVAVTVTGGTEGTDWYFNEAGDELNIASEGAYTVSSWEGEEIRLSGSVLKKGTVNLTLNNVHLSGGYNGIVWWVGAGGDTTGDAKLNLTMNDSSINSKASAISVYTASAEIEKNLNLYVNVTGNNAELNSTDQSAIKMDMREKYFGVMELTLGGTMKMTGWPSVINGQYVYIDGTVLPGIHAEVSENADGSSPTQLNDGKPFSGKSKIAYSEIRGRKFLRLYKPEAPAAPADVPQTGSLPQTGDSSSLALWLCLLAFAGAGMTAMRKRAA